MLKSIFFLISSLVLNRSVINILSVTLICVWVIFLSLGETSYEKIYIFSQTFFGKFISVSLCWTFSFHILNEIRHLAWDLGFGFDLKTSKITGVITILGSFIMTLILYKIGRGLI